jgi:membrane protease YdiL (CAAX protease family)
MENFIKNRFYWFKLLPVITWHIIYLILCNMFDRYTRVYCDLLFYFGIACYFYLIRDWRFSIWYRELKKGKVFWLPVFLTILGMVLMFSVGIGIKHLFPDTNDGMAVLGVNSWSTLIAFAFVTIILPPIAEEVFYRKAIITLDSKLILLISTFVSISLYASIHSLMPLGFLQAFLWGIPFSICYIKTKNTYICMTAHLSCNFVINGITVILTAINLLK